MEKAGTELSTVEAMWQNQANRLALARADACEARKCCNYASAHSIMLSAYITVLGGKPVEGRHPVKFFLLAIWHAICMSRRFGELNHNQLDVWLQFMLKLRVEIRVFSIFDKTLVEGALCEIGRASVHGKPHQLALAYMTYAEVVYTTNVFEEESAEVVVTNVKRALAFEDKIRAEEDQMQGLRQFVRILRKAGELYGGLGDTQRQESYLRRALVMAASEADSVDQADKALALIRKMRAGK